MSDAEQARIDQLVRSAAPDARAAEQEAVRPLLREVAVEISRQRPARRGAGAGALSRWRSRLVVAPLAAGAVLLTAAAGLAVWHNTASPDFERALTQYTAELDLPPGTDRAAYVASVRAQGLERRAAISDVSIRSMVSYYGVCAWLRAWENRQAAGDDPGQAQAVTALRRAISAPAMTVHDGGGVVDNLKQVVAGAARGDRSAVDRELEANCAGLPLDGIR